MATRLEEFFVSLAALPDEVGRSLELVRKLDARVQLLLSETAALSSKCAGDRQLHLRPLLTEKQREAITCAKEKVCIALQVMDTLKNCVAALDQELAEMSKDLNPAVKTEAPPAEVTMDLNDVVGRTYCVCRRPSHGLMVACDNANVSDRQCPHEWFHFECVGLQAQPAGQWFCPNCS